MKIEKQKLKFIRSVYYYYNDTQTSSIIYHGLDNSWYFDVIGYRYHREYKGFTLKLFIDEN